MPKIIFLVILCANLTYASELVKDSTIVSVLNKKYSKINSYYTKFEGNNYAGEIYYKNPDNYRVVDKLITTIINGETTYKINASMEQVIITKTDDTYKLYSPIGLSFLLNKKYDFVLHDSASTRYIFKAKDKYDVVTSAAIEFGDKYLPKKIIILTKDDKTAAYVFSGQKVDKKFDKELFEYTKPENYEEIDLRWGHFWYYQ